MQKLEGRVASDEDLKLSDMLRYYMRDSQAAKVSGSLCACEGGRAGPWAAVTLCLAALGPAVPAAASTG